MVQYRNIELTKYKNCHTFISILKENNNHKKETTNKDIEKWQQKSETL